MEESKGIIFLNPYLIISIVGSHAGEDLTDIFLRKQKEIEKTGKTYWLIQSYKAKTTQVQNLCREAEIKDTFVYCLFIEPSQKGGAKPTLHDSVVSSVSSNNQDWKIISDGIKVTGKINKNSTALVFDELEILNISTPLDLWEYSEFKTKKPIKVILGASTVCCEKIPSHGMKSRYRKIVGVGRLVHPYGLWLK